MKNKAKYTFVFLFYTMILCACDSNEKHNIAENEIALDEIQWTSINSIQDLLKKDKKKIILYFYTDWCTGCKQMDEDTWIDKSLIKCVNQDYYAVKFNAESNEDVNFMGKKFVNHNKYNELVGYFMEHPAYPTAIIFDENLVPIDTLTPCFEINLYAHYYSQNYHQNYNIEDFNDYFELYAKNNELAKLTQLNDVKQLILKQIRNSMK